MRTFDGRAFQSASLPGRNHGSTAMFVSPSIECHKPPRGSCLRATVPLFPGVRSVCLNSDAPATRCSGLGRSESPSRMPMPAPRTTAWSATIPSMVWPR
jgi:hypothetical protein